MDLKSEIDKIAEFFGSELRGFHTGRATISLVEELGIDVYGQRMRLKDIASLSVPEASQIVAEPWDKNNLGPIEKAVNGADLGLTATNQGTLVRINVPPLSSERREELAKVIGKKAEEAKVSLRNIRRDAMEKIEKSKQAREIGEDEMASQKKRVEDQIKEGDKKLQELADQKVAEIKGI
jgi:ribosome recycling factor